MKKHNKTLNTYNKKLYVCMTILLCLFFMLVAMFFSSKIFAVDFQDEEENLKDEVIYENKNPIDLESILKNNTNESIQEEMAIEEIDLEYTTKYKNNNELPNGVVQVLQEGRVGKQNAVIIKKYKDGELISEEQVAENVIKAPAERIVEVGTGNKYNNYKVNEGDTIYIVPESVSVRLLPDNGAEKICTLNKDESAKVLQIVDDWYFISTVEMRGYIPSNCATTKNSMQEETETQYTKQQLLARLRFDMDLREPSGLTLDQFKAVLSNDSNDKKGIFAESAEYFYYIEKQYNINGIFVASVGIHESGWGTSTIANNKKNLFGYGAVDSNPYGGSYSFTSYSEGIDLLARVFVKYYLNPPGTTIYDGTVTSGKFYSGSNLSSVNSRYASDRNWANSVYKWMQYLYNKI